MIADHAAALGEAWRAHVETVLAPRGDEHRIHGGDLHGCDLALFKRLDGEPTLPFDAGAFAMFERGFAYEARIHEAITAYYLPRGFTITHGEEVDFEDVVGHLDFAVYERLSESPLLIIDATTTGGSKPEWKYGHAIKSAFYAVAKGAPRFVEWVFCIGRTGEITAQQAHEFGVDDVALGGKTWRELVHAAIAHKKQVAASPLEPEAVPPVDPRTLETETWRCGQRGKSYCNALCERNARTEARAS